MADILTAEELLGKIKGAAEAYLESGLNSVEEFLKSEKGQEFEPEYKKLQGQNKDSKGSEKDSEPKKEEEKQDKGAKESTTEAEMEVVEVKRSQRNNSSRFFDFINKDLEKATEKKDKTDEKYKDEIESQRTNRDKTWNGVKESANSVRGIVSDRIKDRRANRQVRRLDRKQARELRKNRFKAVASFVKDGTVMSKDDLAKSEAEIKAKYEVKRSVIDGNRPESTAGKGSVRGEVKKILEGSAKALWESRELNGIKSRKQLYDLRSNVGLDALRTIGVVTSPIKMAADGVQRVGEYVKDGTEKLATAIGRTAAKMEIRREERKEAREERRAERAERREERKAAREERRTARRARRVERAEEFRNGAKKVIAGGKEFASNVGKGIANGSKIAWNSVSGSVKSGCEAVKHRAEKMKAGVDKFKGAIDAGYNAYKAAYDR